MALRWVVIIAGVVNGPMGTLEKFTRDAICFRFVLVMVIIIIYKSTIIIIIIHYLLKMLQESNANLL